VDEVRRKGIGLFAVADHDSLASVTPVERLVREGDGLGFIRAVEVSTTLRGHMLHIMAYGVDLRDPALLRMLEENEAKFRQVDEQSIRLLIAAGYDVSVEEYEAYEDDVTRGGWKALNYLIDKGICRDGKDFFRRLFVGDMALTYPAFAATDDAIRVIHRTGGAAICAHPGHSLADGGAALLEELIDCGLDGMECYSPYHDRKTVRRYLDLCRRHDLLVTAGSDCHGGFVGRPLGEPEIYVDDLRLGPLLEYVIRSS
jgi:predicted metal-dependent phosphoesterase TrpH